MRDQFNRGRKKEKKPWKIGIAIIILAITGGYGVNIAVAPKTHTDCVLKYHLKYEMIDGKTLVVYPDGMAILAPKGG